MYELACAWEDTQHDPVPVGLIPVDTIIEMVAYIDRGEPVENLEPFETRESVRERLILELEIRALEGRL